MTLKDTREDDLKLPGFPRPYTRAAKSRFDHWPGSVDQIPGPWWCLFHRYDMFWSNLRHVLYTIKYIKNIKNVCEHVVKCKNVCIQLGHVLNIRKLKMKKSLQTCLGQHSKDCKSQLSVMHGWVSSIVESGETNSLPSSITWVTRPWFFNHHYKILMDFSNRLADPVLLKTKKGPVPPISAQIRSGIRSQTSGQLMGPKWLLHVAICNEDKYKQIHLKYTYWVHITCPGTQIKPSFPPA